MSLVLPQCCLTAVPLVNPPLTPFVVPKVHCRLKVDVVVARAPGISMHDKIDLSFLNTSVF